MLRFLAALWRRLKDAQEKFGEAWRGEASWWRCADAAGDDGRVPARGIRLFKV